ncbi:CPBP family intramembrane glutamic endopeptidase [Flagellimonas onchidii]|uniref:CPBP family intramembrane glutamic endopeptidase n=1 Tax=Flagellimonas onchidii TaxID=2562684 RepID=UPI0014560948|nr:type II CAAX endopeptidase family protein [Allomuricauda onchidii]
MNLIKKHKDLFYFAGLYVSMQVLHLLVLFALTQFNFLSYEQEGIILLVSHQLIFVLGILFTLKWFNIHLQFKFEKCKLNIVLNAFALVLFLYIIQVSIDKPFWDSLVKNELKFLALKNPFDSDFYTGTFTVISIFTAPLLEEVLYRRIIFRKLLVKYNAPTSIIITSLLFALAHLDLEGLLAYFFVGLIYTYLYHLTRSLWLNILVHGLYNLFVSVTAITTYQSTNSFFLIGILIYITCVIGIYLSLKKIKVLTS